MHLMFKSAHLVSLALVLSTLHAQPLNPMLWQNMRWRNIGPFRGGRTVGATGVPSQPNVFYIGVNNGGVWKTNDYGRTWKPIFDSQPTGSIGDIAVSQSNPNIIYAASGEGLQRPDLSVGDGVYKSTDGGTSWRNMGLRDAQQLASIIVDPTDPNRIFVAALGHPYGANNERGVYRSLDGGETWQRVLYKDENTGAIQVAFDPKDPQTIYADLWAARQGPWENGAWTGPGSGLFKSTDGGATWNQLSKGLPTFAQGLGRIGFGIAESNPKIIYATVEAKDEFGGIYRSNDAGQTWRRLTGDGRLWGRGSDFAEVRPHPQDPEIVYLANTGSYVSTDGGKTFKGFKGAPGGDDYHRIWINPNRPEVMLVAADQGAIVTVNGGETWSSWYNQATAQFYHVSTDNQFPYWVYGGQQESGSAGVASRGDYGAITWRDWRTVGAEEYGYVAADPLDPNILIGGKLTRFDKRTGQVQNIAPEPVRRGSYRFLRTAPVLFSTVDPHVLYYAGNVLFKTTTGGKSWQVISPDLSREKNSVPASIGIYRDSSMETMRRRGVIYTVAPSFKNVNTIWAGTDDGLIHITRDGGRKWTNVTPPELTSWSKVSLMEASHYDDETAYAAINRFRLDDLRPHIYRTHDSGKTWKRIVNGIPENEVVNAVREDLKRKGMLYASTERSIYFTLDDGENWLPLRLNMPATSVRDIVVHEDDLVAGTHGRSFWILDDLTPLRQLNVIVAAAGDHLFKPQVTYRVRRSVNTDTPIPPDEPMGQNPPDGAMIDYILDAEAYGPLTLEIFDAKRKLVRRFSSADKPEGIDETKQAYPTYWFRTPRALPTKAGMQRFVWDLHYASPEGFPRTFPISAIYRDTPSEPEGPLVPPGAYTVRLSVGTKQMEQPLEIRMDPRVKASAADIQKMFDASYRCYDNIAKIRALPKNAELDKLAADFLELMKITEEADAAPTAQAMEAIMKLDKAFKEKLVR